MYLFGSPRFSAVRLILSVRRGRGIGLVALPWFSCPAAGLSSRLSQGCLSSSSCFMLLLSRFCRSFCHGVAHLNRFEHFIIREVRLVVFVGAASWDRAADRPSTRRLDAQLWYKPGLEASPNLPPC